MSYCSHPIRRKEEHDCGWYIAVIIYCSICGAQIIQINKPKSDKQRNS